MAGVNGVEAGTDASAYEKSLQEQIRKAEEAEKNKLALQYKYADESKQVALDLKKELSDIDSSILSAEEKKAFSIKAEKDASDKIIAIRLKEFEEYKKLVKNRSTIINSKHNDFMKSKLHGSKLNLMPRKFQMSVKFSWKNS